MVFGGTLIFTFLELSFDVLSYASLYYLPVASKFCAALAYCFSLSSVKSVEVVVVVPFFFSWVIREPFMKNSTSRKSRFVLTCRVL